MPLLVRADAPVAATRGLAAWRIVTWLLLLFAAFGAVQYINHGGAVWQELQRGPTGDASHVPALYRMLAWDAAYLLAAFAIIVWSAGAILRHGWARAGLRFIAVLLAIWTVISGVLLLQAMRPLFPADTGMVAMLGALPHSYVLALAMKAVAVPVLLWLAWQLGHPAVRAQFKRRR